MASILDTFTRADGALGSSETGQAWTVLRGTVTIKTGRAFAVNTNPGPFAVLNAGTSGQDFTGSIDIADGGGQAFYFRVVDANNWWRLVHQVYTTQVATGTQQVIIGYQQVQVGTQQVQTGTLYSVVVHYTNSTGSYSEAKTYSSTDETTLSWPANYTASNGQAMHLVYHDPETTQPIYSTVPIYEQQPIYGSQTVYATVTNYELRLQKTVAGVFSNVQSTALNSAATQLRVLARGSAISVFPSAAATTPTFTVTSTDMATATSHGFGYAETTSIGNSTGIDNFFLTPSNTAPFAPTLQSPVGSAPIDRSVTQRFTVLPSDPDTGDTISSLSLRYRVSGTTTWTTVTQQSPLPYHDFAANTFSVNTWEWQAQTTDAGGLSSPWSGSEFFVAAASPNAPTITSPVNNATLSDPTNGVVTWSASQQEAWQLRVVADASGSPDTSTVYSDTGTVVEAATRSATVARPVNGRVEHTQVRTRYLGLWSNWGSVRNTVGYVGPAAPNLSLTVDGGHGWIIILINYPAPTPPQPAVSYARLWRRKVGSVSSLLLTPSGLTGTSFTDARVANRVSYEYQVEAVGTNGATTLSGWTSTATSNTPSSTDAAAYGAGAYGEGAYGE